MLLERDRPARTISISHEAFIDSILTRFNLTDATVVATPLTPGAHLSADDCPTSKDEIEEMANRPYRELVGALTWLTLGTRPDIAFATSSLGRFGHNSGRVHWNVTKRVVRYLKGTKQWRLTLGGKSPQIAVFICTDAYWGSHRDDRRSIRAYTIKIERWGRQLEVQQAALCRVLLEGSGVPGALSSVTGSLYAAVVVDCHPVKARECRD